MDSIELIIRWFGYYPSSTVSNRHQEAAMSWKPITPTDAVAICSWQDSTARLFFWTRGDYMAVRHELAHEVALRFRVQNGTPERNGLVSIDELPDHTQYPMALLKLRP